MSIEYCSSESFRNRRWYFFLRLPDLAFYNTLFALLGCDSYKIDRSKIDPQDCLSIKGFPDDVDEKSIEEDTYTVDDEANAADIDDFVEARFCSKEEAQSWVDTGQSRFLNNGYKVTDPACYCQSWTSYEEFANIVENVKKYDNSAVSLKAFLAAMTSLQDDGYITRLVYWFG